MTDTVYDSVVYFAHGKESRPWGQKIQCMADVARAKDFHVESPAYSDLSDADARVARLLSLNPRANRNLVLVGSSMGGYVSIVASQTLKPVTISAPCRNSSATKLTPQSSTTCSCPSGHVPRVQS